MSIEKRAARGVAWNMAAGLGTRVIGLVGTLVLTRFIAPAEYGEVSAALICAYTASQLLSYAMGQYIIAHKSKPSVVFQAFVWHTALGIVAMTGLYFLRGPLGALVEAPTMG